MNTYSKFCPNVFVAKCSEQHERGDVIQVTTKYGKENECIAINLVLQKDGFFYYSIIRADGFNDQEYAKKKAEKYQSWAKGSENKSTEFWKKSNKDSDFLSLAEPIKVGHHSEKRHRKIIEQANDNMRKCVEFSDKAEQHVSKAEYWESRAKDINLSMPESLEFYQYELEKAEAKHEGLKNGTIERSHSFSLTYAKKELNEIKKKIELAKRLWAA